jgi:hypothetical protein
VIFFVQSETAPTVKHDTDFRAPSYLCGIVACHSRYCRQLKSYCLVHQLHISVNKGLGMGFTGTARNQSMKVQMMMIIIIIITIISTKHSKLEIRCTIEC